MSNGMSTTDESNALLASVGVGQWNWDGSQKCLSLDATSRQFFDLARDDEVSMQVLQDKIHPDDFAAYAAAVSECMASGIFATEIRVRKPNGGYRHLSGRGHTVAETNSNEIIRGVYIDVSANKDLENQLQATRSRMQQLADGVPGYFSYIDKDYIVQFMNEQYREVLGEMGVGQLEGKHIRHLIGEAAFAERKSHYDTSLAGEAVHFEATRLTPAGRMTYFDVVHKPHYDAHGNVIGTMGLGIDITERREAEILLEKKSDELVRSNKDLEQFAYVASHDLKAPLRAIDVLIEWLKDDLEGFEEGDVQENLNLLEARTKRLGVLLDDLLAYSRAGRKVGDVREINMKSFAEDVAMLLAPPEGFQIIADDSLDLTFRAHHAPLETVLRNLISNAIKHHPAPERGVIKIVAQDQGDSILLGIEDNGPGIPEEYAEKVFKMFQTLQSRDETEGSGMGLAIVQRIIDWQGGKVWFHPAVEGGTVFKFIWNKSPQDMPEMAASSNSTGDTQEESDERNQNQAS